VQAGRLQNAASTERSAYLAARRAAAVAELDQVEAEAVGRVHVETNKT